MSHAATAVVSATALLTAAGLPVPGNGIAATSTPRLRWLAIPCGRLDLLIVTMPLEHYVGVNWLWPPGQETAAPQLANCHGEPSGQLALSGSVFLDVWSRPGACDHDTPEGLLVVHHAHRCGWYRHAAGDYDVRRSGCGIDEWREAWTAPSSPANA